MLYRVQSHLNIYSTFCLFLPHNIFVHVSCVNKEYIHPSNTTSLCVPFIFISLTSVSPCGMLCHIVVYCVTFPYPMSLWGVSLSSVRRKSPVYRDYDGCVTATLA